MQQASHLLILLKRATQQMLQILKGKGDQNWHVAVGWLRIEGLNGRTRQVPF